MSPRWWWDLQDAYRAGKSRGVVHREGCAGPSYPTSFLSRRFGSAAVLPVADGRGGTIERCRLCGATSVPVAATPDDSKLPTTEEVVALRDQLITEGKDAGAGSLAKRLGTSEATIRRRLGRIK